MKKLCFFKMKRSRRNEVNRIGFLSLTCKPEERLYYLEGTVVYLENSLRVCELSHALWSCFCTTGDGIQVFCKRFSHNPSNLGITKWFRSHRVSWYWNWKTWWSMFFRETAMIKISGRKLFFCWWMSQRQTCLWEGVFMLSLSWKMIRIVCLSGDSFLKSLAGLWLRLIRLSLWGKFIQRRVSRGLDPLVFSRRNVSQRDFIWSGVHM